MRPDPLDLALDFTRDIYSVARLASEARAVLDGSFPSIWVRGEISNLALPASGHCYFTLKDEAAQVRCAMFRAKRLLLAFKPQNGQQVLVRARVTLYEARSEFQLVVEHMEPGGEGALRLELTRLKRRLAAEGLFAPSAKRPLPTFPRQVGLITSPTGAAVHDLLTVLGRRCPGLPVLIYPAQVQGATAPASLIAALQIANTRAECDVLILARGGGSLEDLNAFNDESLARAIRASRIPVVSGVGHEIDTTIADLAADCRGATPSAAAELVAPAAEHLGQRVTALSARLRHLEERLIEGAGLRLTAVLRHLTLLHPAARLEQRAQHLDELERRLRQAMDQRLRSVRAQLEPRAIRLTAASPARRLGLATAALGGLWQRLHWAQSHALAQRNERLVRAVAGLDGRSPLATLARGYAIVTRLPDGEILRHPNQAPPGTRIAARLADGLVEARVESN
ncbi:exodeoxyribonuclease VII large subunit [uncultured Thiodictyon sp.]|uniref:exodeoxyribonuclease VII large subunit n=1 Tax=uncultured Thiodictyon sp. TaxID=1846217 RepID=UPI0025DAA9DF|nr:exodeoxyribonuclease VII large subunit [uncultured Thiodictyon sp.]